MFFALYLLNICLLYTFWRFRISLFENVYGKGRKSGSIRGVGEQSVRMIRVMFSICLKSYSCFIDKKNLLNLIIG